ncbi:MAG: hypothetical protein H6853_02030 [Rhodospirillales bacterium]|nr:hypothetical protein [Alphaproteobacteria bacterium]USO04078.1 MAG: hypothetical protein H6853_02030 [Rhodospirillales bacterium]
MPYDVTDGSSLAEVSDARRALGGSGEQEIRTARAQIETAAREAAVLDDPSAKGKGGDSPDAESKTPAAADSPEFEVYSGMAMQAAGVGGAADLMKMASERIDAAKGVDLAGISKKMGGMISSRAQTADQWAMTGRTSQTLIDSESSKYGLGEAYRTGGNMFPKEDDFKATKKMALAARKNVALEQTQTLTKQKDLAAGNVYAAERGVQGYAGHIMRTAPEIGATMTAGSRPKNMVAMMQQRNFDLSSGPKGPTTNVIEEETMV